MKNEINPNIFLFVPSSIVKMIRKKADSKNKKILLLMSSMLEAVAAMVAVNIVYLTTKYNINLFSGTKQYNFIR